jgi:hypothetical protein
VKDQRWTEPTPVSLRNQKAQKHAEEVDQRARWIRNTKRVRTEPTKREREEAQRQHDAGLVRSAAAQELHKSGAAYARPKVLPWLEPKDRRAR